MSYIRLALLVSVCMAPFFICSSPASAVINGDKASRSDKITSNPIQVGVRVSRVRVVGNTHIETSAILANMLIQPGSVFDRDGLARTIKTLFATGLFKNVWLTRQGSVLIVHVIENPLINRIVFVGNTVIKSEELQKSTSLRVRSMLTSDAINADRQKILEAYGKKGRYAVSVMPQMRSLPNNMVDLVYKINEGSKTLVKVVAFVGNKAFSQAKLRGVVSSSETAWYTFLTSTDEYNPNRVRYDSELLRRFYLQNGYLDFDIKDATGEISLDRRSFYITFTLNEGNRYKLTKLDVRSNIRNLDSDQLRQYVEMYAQQWYDGVAVQKNASDMQEKLQERGFPFAVVNPVIARNPEKHTVNLLFDVTEGPRLYINQIDIVGNSVTQDTVIRHQIDVAEGDPYTELAKRNIQQAVEDLGYFKSVRVDTVQTPIRDRVNLRVAVEEKPTGEFTLGGGYSSDVGVLGNIGVQQRNFLGTGVDAGVSGTIAYYTRQATLSVSDPYFLDKNMLAGIDLYYIENNFMTYQNYAESRLGQTMRVGYALTNSISQSWAYSTVSRKINDYYDGASYYIQDQSGRSLLSQLGTSLVYDTRDSRLFPHSGWLGRISADIAGLGGDARYVRSRIDVNYNIPMGDIFGNPDWTLSFRNSFGYIADWGNGRKDIIDNFYLGGDTLRGFADGGVGPRVEWIPERIDSHGNFHPRLDQQDFLGGRMLTTASVTLNFPLPGGDDMGLLGRYFVDSGSLNGARVAHDYRHASGENAYKQTGIYDANFFWRISTGVGFSWKSPFGLLNIDIGYPLVKKRHDRMMMFRLGFGQQF